jgi:hypothetical protein
MFVNTFESLNVFTVAFRTIDTTCKVSILLEELDKKSQSW